MKRIFVMILLPILASIMLIGCGKNIEYTEVNTLFGTVKTAYVVEEENIFFSDESNPYTLVIKYSQDILNAITNNNPTNDLQKRYKALEYQQIILNYIYNYYQNNQSEFYRIMSSENYTKSEMNELYNSLQNLKNTIDNFISEYEIFSDSANMGVSDIMTFSISSYSYQINRVIESSFDFIFKFENLFSKYCITDELNATNISIVIDKVYVQIAYVVYYENFKAFNYSVGQKGICDLAPVINVSNDYSLLNLLGDIKVLSNSIVDGLLEDSPTNTATMATLDDFFYTKSVFEQRLQSYITIYNTQDIYTISQYRFNMVNSVSYQSYKDLLTSSARVNIEMLEIFLTTVFLPFVNKLNLITA